MRKRRLIAVAGLAALLVAGGAGAADAHVGFSIGIGIPGIVFGAPIYPAPAYYPSYPPPYYGYRYGYDVPAYYYGPPVGVGGYFGRRYGRGGGYDHRHFDGGHRSHDGHRGWR